ncbi:MAG: phosphopantothenoylcysteine decarboxylase [Planctomycetota bacterium]|nr:hypothetical protein [Planctomycetota bacterium]MCX8039582.1 hypothetical protein [Planctomycetota bacterium]MDW8373127.1 phosphopantothenoylcysteine decarboxylase [Planctomycetota bacterium]
MPRPVLLVGGAPRVPIDAVRCLVASASGATALALAQLLAARGRRADLLLAGDAQPQAAAWARYGTRQELEARLAAWIAEHPDGAVVMSAAVNDYELAGVEWRRGAAAGSLAGNEKLPSGCDEVLIRLRPAGKLIDRLRDLGLRGPIVGFKYEAAATVLASAAALRARVGAACVAANSLCGRVHALVDAEGSEPCADRRQFLERLAARIAAL